MHKILRLIRFDKPVGTLLLWYPTAWALWLSQSHPATHIVILLFLGTFVMRSAGCIINDIADRQIDPYVERTQYRPLASGEVSLTYALSILFILLIIALFILMMLPKYCIYPAFIALLITTLYPFSKRRFKAPQLILSLAFSMGIPIAYLALGLKIQIETVLLFIANMLWIICYDTLYAMADRKDDLKIGINSTALLFDKKISKILYGCLIAMSVIWIIIAYYNSLSFLFYIFFTIATVYITLEYIKVFSKNDSNYTQAFIRQSYYGLFIWLALLFK